MDSATASTRRGPRCCTAASARPAGWAALCADAVKLQPRNEHDVRRWLEQNLQPYSIQPLQGSSPGLLTGYYEPVPDDEPGATAKFRYPLYGVPADLAQRRPYWTRQQIDTLPAAQASLRGREIAYVADPLEALVLHIQGSGRMLVTEPGGKVRTVRLAYAGNNGHPYQSVGRWLIDRGELAPGQASWPEIKAWTQRNPTRINELLWVNPRYVFFREEPLPDPTLGPRGAQGVPLTPGRSIAVDPQSVPYGTPVWIAQHGAPVCQAIATHRHGAGHRHRDSWGRARRLLLGLGCQCGRQCRQHEAAVADVGPLAASMTPTGVPNAAVRVR